MKPLNLLLTSEGEAEATSRSSPNPAPSVLALPLLKEALGNYPDVLEWLRDSTPGSQGNADAYERAKALFAAVQAERDRLQKLEARVFEFFATGRPITVEAFSDLASESNV